jgi:tetratricopeptide (TPR) repeat protein
MLVLTTIYFIINRDQTSLNLQELSPSAVTKQTDNDEYINIINQGIRQYNSGNSDEALKLWNRAMISNPNKASAYAMKSILATSTEKMELLDLAILKDPNYGYAYELKAFAYKELGKFKEALSYTKKAIEAGGYTYEVYKTRSFVNLSLGNIYNALDDSQEAIRENPYDSESWVLKGSSLYAIGICLDAYDAFKIAVDMSYGGELETQALKSFSKYINLERCIDIDEESDNISPATTTSDEGSMFGIGV